VGFDGLSLVGNFSHKKVKKALEKIEGVRVLEGCNLLVEIKDEEQPESKRKLTPDEVEWHQKWRGQVHIVEGVRAAILLLAANRQQYEYMCLRAGVTPESEKINWENRECSKTKS
jgi:hypothetical protein